MTETGNMFLLRSSKRWKAVIEYESDDGPHFVEHFIEKISELQEIIDHGRPWIHLISCTVTPNRDDRFVKNDQSSNGHH